ncbi:MAG TPA: T9SS type A sorting domain-containing protein [Lentimicrobium sp.]|nr:T9SS type A sorting domain-containing protein [Lentimicrobium sp.]
MRKSLLLVFLMALCISAFTQKSPTSVKPQYNITTSPQIKDLDDNQLMTEPSVVNFTRPSTKGTSDISVINIGNGGNAYGLYNGMRTAVWADPNINTVAFFHRMIANPGTGFIAYDVSKDGGDTWSINNQIFDPTQPGTANARYPQGVLYNPDGNTVPDNAYASGFFPTLDGSNAGAGSWGGYGAATVKLDGTGLSQVGWPSDPPIRHNVPDGMTINPVTGDIFVVEPALIDGLTPGYTDTLVLVRGVFNSTLGAFEYEETPLYVPTVHITDEAPLVDAKIAFAPDGMTGYISMLGDDGNDEWATASAYYPVLYKTTDGGNTWDGPITVILGGPEGLEGITGPTGLFSDSALAEVFTEPLPARDELVYTTAFSHDFAVDMFGNPIISVVIGLSGVHGDPPQAYSILSGEGMIASYNICSLDQGTTWYAVKLAKNLKRFRGTWGDVSEDNRSALTSSKDGKIMIFSWLDTPLAETADNSTPDIFCVGWNVETNMYTADISNYNAVATNVTYLSDAWLQAFMGTASRICLEPSAGIYEVPFVYQTIDQADPTLPVQYKYIKDFQMNDAQFIYVAAKNYDVPEGNISQNYPNPFSIETRLSIELTSQSVVGLELYNLVGQKVFEIPSAQLATGSHQLTIPATNLKAGIYAYSVIINGNRYSNKMIVE